MKILPGTKFEDDRGIIQNILNEYINHIAIITSKAGSIRSNHYHKTNSHYIYVLSGLMEYWERDIDNDVKTIIVCGPGDMVLSESNKVHKTIFLEDTVIITFAKGERDFDIDKYDTIKMEL